MATPKKRSSTGFIAKPSEEAAEKREIEEFLDEVTVETFVKIEKQEEVTEDLKEEVIQEITPTVDPGLRLMEKPVLPVQPPVKPVEIRKPKQHPRNIPRFNRTSK